MKLFLDTADLGEVRWASQAGLIDGVTTNPTLLNQHAGDVEPHDVLKEICSLVDGPVSAEVVAVDAEGMYREARELAKLGENIVVKIPMLEDGLVAVRRLTADGIKTNVTLAFSSVQCLLAAKAGATFVSPFLGRLDDIGHDSMEIVRRGPADLRQLRSRDGDSGSFDPTSPACGRSGHGWSRRRHHTDGGAQEAATAPPHGSRPGQVPQRLEQTRRPNQGQR